MVDSLKKIYPPKNNLLIHPILENPIPYIALTTRFLTNMSTLALRLLQDDRGEGKRLRGMIFNGKQVFSVYDFIFKVCDQ